MMDHPNIARVFDAGATETGRPYFVMELVRGIPITRFADDNKLTTRQRVELLVPICQAVQHAHQKGIIHRDIKPHNVLVTLHDGKPVPKVIDFGIAKATSQPLTDKTVYTEFRQMIGTPAYMSPEQAEMSGLDIDTRSDIYSLGVLAYELLTGIPPFDNERLVKAGLGEIQRIIREEDPPRPSIRFSTIGDRLTTIAKSRDVEPSKLSKLLAGELDWIVMRAIEKDRRRRYDTATDLAADFNRHLSGEPVIAAPPTWRYRTRKFVRKHRGPVIAAAAIIAVLALGLGGTSWEAFRVAKERRRAVDANAHLRDDQETAIETLGEIVPPTPGISRHEKAESMVAGAKSVAHDKSLGSEGPEISEVGFLASIAKRNYRWLQEKTDAAELEAYTADLALAQSAIDGNNYDEARRRLAACPEGIRGFEWRFLNQKAQQIVESFTDMFVGFNQNLQLIVSWSGTDTAKLWDLNGKRVGSPFRTLAPLVVSPDGKLIATWSGTDSAQLWDPSGKRVGNPIRTLAGLRFTPDGKLLVATTGRGTIQLLDLNGTPVSEPIKHVEDAGLIDFCIDKQLMLVEPAPDLAQVYNFLGRPVGKPFAEIWSDQTPGFAPGGATLVTYPSDDTVQLRGPDGEPLGASMPTLKGSTASLYSDGNRIAVESQLFTFQLFDYAGKPVGDPIVGMGFSFSADGKSLLVLANAGGTKTTVRLCDSFGKPKGPAFTSYFNSGFWFGAEGDRFLTGPDPFSIQVRRADGSPVGHPHRFDSEIRDSRFSKDRKLIYVELVDRTAYMLDSDGNEIGEPAREDSEGGLSTADGMNLVFTEDGSHLITTSDYRGGRAVSLWNFQGRLLGTSGEGWSPKEFQVWKDKIFATFDYGTGGRAQLFRADNFDSPIRTIDESAYPVEQSQLICDRMESASPPASAPPSAIAVTVDDEKVIVGTGTGRVVLSHDRPVVAAAVNPEGSRVATVCDRHVRFWDPVSARELAVIRVASDVKDLKFTPDGLRLIVYFTHGIVQIWDSRDAAERQKERDSLHARSKAGREYAAKLLASSVPTNRLLETVLADRSVDPLLRSEAFQWTRVRITDLDYQANVEFQRICSGCFDKRDAQAAVDHNSELAGQPRIVEKIIELIGTFDWSKAAQHQSSVRTLPTTAPYPNIGR